MSKEGKDYQKIIKQLEGLREHCSDMKKGGESVWEMDELALQEAMDIIADYEKATAQTAEMIRKYETETPAIHRGMDVYQCPACGKRTSKNHTHCHWCGKKLGWGR